MDVEDALRIAEDFRLYLNSGDESKINKYSKEELRAALNVIPFSDSRHQWYKEIERRIAHLESEEQKKSEKRNKRKEKWIDRSIGFGIGILASILSGLVVAYLKGCFKLK